MPRVSVKRVRARRTFSEEFKQEAVQMLLDGNEAYLKATRAMGRQLSAAMKDKPVVEIDGMKVERENRADDGGRERREMRFSAVPGIFRNAPGIKTPISGIPGMGVDSFQNADADTCSNTKGSAPIPEIAGFGDSFRETQPSASRRFAADDWTLDGCGLLWGCGAFCRFNAANIVKTVTTRRQRQDR
jgi:hypothetical protein